MFRHSAVLHDSAMWVFGGMTDLQERADFWKFDFSKYLIYKYMFFYFLIHNNTDILTDLINRRSS